MNTLEVMPHEPAPLALNLDEGLEPATAASLREAFQAYFEQADAWRAKALTIQITSPTQVREMRLARETRLALREIRINADKTRKRLKEDSLRKGKAIDGLYNMLAFAVQPLETHLAEQEQFIERMEQARKAKLKAEREAELAPFGVDCSLYQLGEMAEDVWQQLLETNRLAYAQRQEAARKAEAERIAREKAEAEERAKREAEQAAERERLRQEAERLRAEKEAAEAAAQAERAKAEEERRKAEAKAKAEREARQRAEAELAAKQEAERKAKEAAEAEAKAAQAAPDRDKLDAFAAALRALPVPSMQTHAGKDIENLIRSQMAKFAAWIITQKTKLN